ncbi:MAG TPA: carbohydrate kinase family protein [Rhodoglobus sp.]|nr:carbohydrate kinase family protein [Rhodoglobus sp.]
MVTPGMTAPPPLLVVGELCVDVIVQLERDDVRFGQHEQLVASTTLTMGSSSAITACGAARLGVPTALVAVRGDDVFGRFLADELQRHGVDGAVGRVDPSLPTGSSTHLARPDGDRAILTAMGSIGAVSGSDVPDSLLRAHAHLHVGSYFLQESLWRDAPDLFAHARALGLGTSLDGNFDPALGWDRGIRDVLPHVQVLFGNEQELLGISGADGLTAAVSTLLDLLPPDGVVVLKLGRDGAEVHTRAEVARAAAPNLRAPVVDTVGAGDSLAAGFLASRLRGEALERNLAIGVACGTASVRGAGGTGAQATWDEAVELAQIS